MRLARTSGTQLHKVVVLLYKRHKTQQIVQLFLLAENIGLISRTSEKQRYPFVLCEIPAGFLYFIKVKIRHLDRLKRGYFKWGIIL